MNKLSKTYKKWQNIIDDKQKWSNAPFSEHEVIYLRKAIGSSGLKCIDERYTLLSHFQDTMPETGFNITVDHQQKGIDYLRNNTYKKNGTLRKNNILGSFERGVIDNFKEFKLVDLRNASENSYDFYLPIYRCIAKDGSYFDYTGTVYSMIKITDINAKTLVAV
jgi:hypothetical protein